jgi:hypothetical protein
LFRQLTGKNGMATAASQDLSILSDKGFEIDFRCHAKSILSVDFPGALADWPAPGSVDSRLS